jgi:hypothetical protein
MNPYLRYTLLSLAALVLIFASAQGSEIGTNDQRLSFMGLDGDPSVDAKTPVMAYNSVDNEVLVVWSADMIDGAFEIWGQRIHASTGVAAGGPFQISFGGAPEFDALEPDVVFNADAHEYLVVWSSDMDNDGAEEIYGQRLSHFGEHLGPMGFRISDMGANDADPLFDANTPAVAWNSNDGEYLVVWSGDDDTTTAEGEFSIFSQHLAADGSEIGSNDILSAPTPSGYDFLDPELAYNSWDNQYLLVFEAYDRVGSYPGPEVGGDILGRDALSLTPGSRYISAMGGDPYDEFHGKNPVACYDASHHWYLVAWDGDHVVDEEFEIYACLIDPDDASRLSAQTRMSDMGNNGSPAAAAIHPTLAYDANLLQYMVAWQGDDAPGTTANAEPEIFAQLFDPFLSELGSNDFRLSDMGPDPTSPFEAASATAVFNPVNNLYLVGWSGDDDAAGLVVGEEEIFLQRWGGTPTSTENLSGPARLALYANVPNPFNPSTTIYYDVPEGTPEVSLRIYDVGGRLVRTLVQGRVPAGRHSVQWRGRDQRGRAVASGVYHLRMHAGSFHSTQKLTLVQ